MNYQSGACSCDSCKAACSYKPGWFSPDQIEPLAANLGLTPQELFDQHLQVDWWVDDPDVFVLSPRLRHETGGSMMPVDSTGECHWFVDGKCAIHDLGKPFECQQLDHSKVNHHEAAADRWRDEEHQQMIEDLYGEQPYAPEASIFDMMSMMLGRSEF